MLILWWCFLILTCVGYGIMIYEALEEGNSTPSKFVAHVIGVAMNIFLFHYSYLYLTQ